MPAFTNQLSRGVHTTLAIIQNQGRLADLGESLSVETPWGQIRERYHALVPKRLASFAIRDGCDAMRLKNGHVTTARPGDPPVC